MDKQAPGDRDSRTGGGADEVPSWYDKIGFRNIFVLTIVMIVATMLTIPLELIKNMQQIGSFYADTGIGLLGFLKNGYNNWKWVLVVVSIYTLFSVAFRGVVSDLQLIRSVFLAYIEPFVPQKSIKSVILNFLRNAIFGVIPLLLLYPLTTFRTLLITNNHLNASEIYGATASSFLYKGLGYAVLGVVVYSFVSAVIEIFVKEIVFPAGIEFQGSLPVTPKGNQYEKYILDSLRRNNNERILSNIASEITSNVISLDIGVEKLLSSARITSPDEVFLTAAKSILSEQIEKQKLQNQKLQYQKLQYQKQIYVMIAVYAVSAICCYVFDTMRTRLVLGGEPFNGSLYAGVLAGTSLDVIQQMAGFFAR